MERAFSRGSDGGPQDIKFHEAMGAKAMLDLLLTGILDQMARDLLGGDDLQELNQLQDYMPTVNWGSTDMEETTHG
jgi:hypothetical protein